MKSTIIVTIIFVLATLALSAPTNKYKAKLFSKNKIDVDNEWNSFRKNHGKSYKNEQDETNRLTINSLNYFIIN